MNMSRPDIQWANHKHEPHAGAVERKVKGSPTLFLDSYFEDNEYLLKLLPMHAERFRGSKQWTWHVNLKMPSVEPHC